MNTNIYNQIQAVASKEILEVIHLLGSQRNHHKIYLVGGIIRDALLNHHCYDLDITVEEDALLFSHSLVSEFPDLFRIVEENSPFHTVKVQYISTDHKFYFDIASTRTEYYQYPGALPTLKRIGVPLEEDLPRRDFTVNALAGQLISPDTIFLLDYPKSMQDLRKKQLCIFHPNSFMDDPTRMIRALKFMLRFQFTLEKQTESLMQNCLQSGQFDNLAGERVKLELMDFLKIDSLQQGIILQETGVYRLIDTTFQYNKEYLSAHQETFDQLNSWISSQDIPLIKLGLFFQKPDVAKRLYCSGYDIKILKQSLKLEKQIPLSPLNRRSEIFQCFRPYENPAIIMTLMRMNNPNLTAKGLQYLQELKNIKLEMNGNRLIEMGYTPSPKFRKVLENTLFARIDGELTTYHDEKEFITALLNRND